MAGVMRRTDHPYTAISIECHPALLPTASFDVHVLAS